MSVERPIYFSFFMFDANTRLYDARLRASYIEHMKVLVDYGYAGFELHTGRSPEVEIAYPTYADEIEAYAAFRRDLDSCGLGHVQLATNVGATPALDPSSDDPSVRRAAGAFLRSRVDIGAALRAEILMGPVVIPYAGFVHSAPNADPLWSDALQDQLSQRYQNAAPVLDELGEHARRRGVKIAIEPITHWETPGPNTLAQLIQFLRTVRCNQVGAIIDSAHETLDGAGPDVFPTQVAELIASQRLHYVQASPPDRGDLQSSWLPWGPIFQPLLAAYQGPVAIEIFNAVPAFADGLRLSRRKYWVPGIDAPSSAPSAYDVAKGSLCKLRAEFAKLE
ncbi:MAG TPA: sugar phosphate isomerase/epimerase family protein [Polyangiaceae bacterium]|nr:sugar phosphate isomerase/epimerase family protein [Polyangiaceae bacterium]